MMLHQIISIVIILSTILFSYPDLVLATRMHSIGFELNSISSVEFFDNLEADATITSTASKVRSGTYALEVSSLSSGQQKGFQFAYAPSGTTNNGPFYFRFYLYIVTLPSGNNVVFKTLPGSSSLTTSITLNSLGQLILSDEDGQIGSASSALSTNTWYRVEMEADLTGAAGSDIVKARIDGTEFAAATDRSISNDLERINFGGNLSDETQTTGEWYFDDIAVNDTNGSSQTSYPGSGKIIHLLPNAAGDFAEGSIGAGSGSAYELVDEVVPNDATDYWLLVDPSTGSTDPDRLDVNVESSSSKGIGSSDTITLVAVNARISNDGSGTSQHNVRIKSQASGTLSEGSLAGIIGATWHSNEDTAPTLMSKLVSFTDPQAGGSWTPALLDSMQIGIRAPDATPDLYVSTLWAQVEYVPVAAAQAGTGAKIILNSGRFLLLNGRIIMP